MSTNLNKIPKYEISQKPVSGKSDVSSEKTDRRTDIYDETVSR